MRWTLDGQALAPSPPPSPPSFVRELFTQYGEAIAELEVRRASLEDTYLALVRDRPRWSDEPAA